MNNQNLFWVIEGDGVYWDGRGTDTLAFTPKIEDAVRFSRSQDADVVKHWLLRQYAFSLRTTQHSCIDSVLDCPA